MPDPEVLLLPAAPLNRYISRHFPGAGKTFQGDRVALHATRRGAVALRPSEAAPPAAAFADAGAAALDRIVERAAVCFPAIQHYRELRAFLDAIAARPPQVVVEIGTGSGGLLFCLCQVAAADACVLSIDARCDEEDRALFSSFARVGQRCQVLRGSSLALSTRDALRDALRGRPIDLLFIDGCHDYGAVKSDFQLYGDLVADGGVIAFHDITVYPETHGPGMDVGVFWSELKAHHPASRISEIIDPAGARSMAQWQERMAALLAAHPGLSGGPRRLQPREVLAAALRSEFVTEAPGALPSLRSLHDLPAWCQMSWGIGTLTISNT